MKKTTLMFLVISLTLALAGCSLASEPIPAGPVESGPLPGDVLEAPALDEGGASDVPASMPVAAQGETIYLENCVRCHGPNGSGEGELTEQVIASGGTLPDFSDPALARERSPQDWFSIITNGNMAALMPPWSGSLSDVERWDTAYYLYRFTATDEVLAQGEALYNAEFVDLYGEQGAEIGLNDPATAATLSQADIVEQFIADSGIELAPDEQWAVAAYMQSFGYAAALDGTVAETAEQPADQPAEEAETGGEETPAEEATQEPAAEEAPADGLGVVRGTVMAEAGLPDGLEVQLRGVNVNDANQVEEFLSTAQPVAADGSFTFSDVPFDVPRSAYVVEVTYEGVQFSNGQIIETGMAEMDLPVTLYQSTTDTSLVRVDAMHLVIDEQPDALQVTQVLVFSNSGDKIVVTEQPVAGGRKGTVAVAVPPDAYSIAFEDGSLGGRFIPVSDRIYDTEQIFPGDQSHSIILTYLLPYEGRSEFSLPVLYDTLSVTVLMQEGPRVQSDVLSEAGVQVIGEEAYQNYVGTNLAAGDTLSFSIAPTSNLGRVLPTVALALAGGLLIGGGLYWTINRRQMAPAYEVAGLAGPEESLVREIADLDAAYEAGKINRFDWEARRAALKADLAELLEG